MSTDLSSLTGGPRVPVNNTAAPATGNNVVSLRPATRQSIAAPASEPVDKATQVAAPEDSQTSRIEQQKQQDAEALRAKVEELNQNAQSVRRSLRFDVDDDTGITVITVRDRETDEVIRQIPSEELLELARYFAEASESQGESKGLLLRAEV
jgi:flagellar protein FlaG